MPYRLTFPTVNEFIQLVVSQYSATLKTATIQGPNGPESVRYLERIVGGETLQAALQETPQMLYRNDVRSLCTKLKIPTNIFDARFDAPMERYFDYFGRMIDPDEEKDN